MPVPAKELDVLVREIYTFGGPGQPDMSVVAGGAGGDAATSRSTTIRSVREIWKDYQTMARMAAAIKH
jgi:hypothetical protein